MSSSSFRILSAALLVAGGTAWACSLIQAPNSLQQLAPGEPLVLRRNDAGTDTEVPSKPVISALQVRLIEHGCNGSGASCPDLDTLTMTVTASDAYTSAQSLRYLAAFGDTAAAAENAAFSVLFEPDISQADKITAFLGFGGRREEADFSRTKLCFVLAAVDDAGNISARSDGQCVDTTDVNAPTTQRVAGHPCTMGVGCSTSALSTGAATLVLALLFFAHTKSLKSSLIGPSKVT